MVALRRLILAILVPHGTKLEKVALQRSHFAKVERSKILLAHYGTNLPHYLP